MFENILKKIKFDEENENKINIKHFIKYFENNFILILLTFVILFVSHLYILNNSNIGIDTDRIIEDPNSNYNWIEIGRYGLIIEKQLLHLDFFSLFYSEVLTMVFLFIFCILTYYLIYVAIGKDIKYLNLIIPLIGMTSPIWAEQFIFTLQIAEISFALVLTVLASLFLLKWILEKSKISCIICLILLTITFGTYQSFIAVGMAFVLFIGIIIFENKNEHELLIKDFWKIIFKLLFSIIIPIIAYFCICKLVAKDSTYLKTANSWFTSNSIKDNIIRIFNHCLDIIKGKTIYYNIGLLIGNILMIIIGLKNTFSNKSINKVFNRIVYYCMILALLVIPFLLTIYAGSAQFVRSEFYIPIIEALTLLYSIIFIEQLKLKSLNFTFLILVLVITLEQSYYLESLYYTENLARERDREITYQIAHDLKANGVKEGTKLFFYGHIDSINSKSAIRGEFIGTSAYEFCYGTEPLYNYTTSSIVRLLKAYGFNYEAVVNEDEIFDARCLGAQEIIPSWPEDGSIIKTENFVLVKINQN